MGELEVGKKECVESFRSIVGGYGILAIPTKSVGQLWQIPNTYKVR